MILKLVRLNRTGNQQKQGSFATKTVLLFRFLNVFVLKFFCHLTYRYNLYISKFLHVFFPPKVIFPLKLLKNKIHNQKGNF